MSPCRPEPNLISIENFERLAPARRAFLAAQFGSLEGAVAEYHHRRFAHEGEHTACFRQAEESRLAHEAVALRDLVLKIGIEQNKAEISAREKRIGELRAANVEMVEGREKLGDELGKVAERSETDRRALQAWDAFLQLETARGQLDEALCLCGWRLNSVEMEGVESGGGGIDECS